jgi:hypothetical protein
MADKPHSITDEEMTAGALAALNAERQALEEMPKVHDAEHAVEEVDPEKGDLGR